ncbi:Gfo/Idh/MocA family oxidoreductase [Herbidospora sp. NEAU-GS84]|uniref:Gfo/Idh/MocA family oxidoreductase n=1 Tax=Herbidospora solisilvae TaxID=2696284 RepID=A0A7C9MZW5_9ACTN|nr:Gfo/Idh/MocA family oxidoreductase [Herbidospora solisilvae]NAS20234.1 Gfo/Idh/MocA family oxidoreductase [Herbidospora solisilvae]
MTSSPPLRWAVIGTGGIARQFADDLRLSESAELVAVGSRTAARAEAFAAEVGAPRAHGDVAAMLAADDVDAVYVATPHPAHHAGALAAIEAGKAVLVEKPFTINRREAEELVAAARARGVFLMEAMWTRFLPHMVRIRELLAEGRLGDVRLVVAEHGVWFRHDPVHRMFDLALGGGALLDLGVYPVSFLSMVFGAPATVTASTQFGGTGVDGQTSVITTYEGGRQGVATSSMEAFLPNRASIAGTEAHIDIDPWWYRPTSFTLTTRGGAAERFTFDVPGNGLRFQAEEVARCVHAGLLESPILTLEESCRIMGTMDEVRAQAGLRYPGE